MNAASDAQKTTVAHAPAASTAALQTSYAHCRNCGSLLTGAFCSNCGQSAHLHRTLSGILHDVLHGVFHFDSKLWRTLPELLFRPGRLTRRYIDGERAKFISPLALFLFTVFTMFAVFGLVEFMVGEQDTRSAQRFQGSSERALAEMTRQIAELKARREDTALAPEQRAGIDAQIADIEASRAVLAAVTRGDLALAAEMDRARKENRPPADAGAPPSTRVERLIDAIQANPQLALYKLKTNAYKFSWMLIPLSLPFLWLLFCWRRDVHLYDHAIFATYSLSFMTVLITVIVAIAALPWSFTDWAIGALTFAPPIHLYKQLRGTYGLSRFSAAWRLLALLVITSWVFAIFVLLVVWIAGIG
jgi:hypothetical protein